MPSDPWLTTLLPLLGFADPDEIRLKAEGAQEDARRGRGTESEVNDEVNATPEPSKKRVAEQRTLEISSCERRSDLL